MKWVTLMLFINVNKCVVLLKDEFDSSAIYMDRISEESSDIGRRNSISSRQKSETGVERTYEKTFDNILGAMSNSEESVKNAFGRKATVDFRTPSTTANNSTSVRNGSETSKSQRKTISERRRRTEEETENKTIYKRRRNKLGKKLALKPLLRKYRLHKGRFNKRFSKNTRKFDGNDSGVEKNLITLSSPTNLQNETRKKRCNKFDVYFNIRVPERAGTKLDERETNRFVIDKDDIPHEVSVDRGNTAWSVRIKNFKKMNVNSNPDRFHVDTHYSNLKSAECRRKKCTTCSGGTTGRTTPQYSLNFVYDTDKNETQIKVSSLERMKKKKKTMVKKVWDEIHPEKQKSTTSEARNTASTAVPCSELTTKCTHKQTTTDKFKTDKIPKKFKWNREKTTVNPKILANVIASSDKKMYDKKSGSYALVSCLGLHGDSQYFNQVVRIKQTPL